jgi:UDP-N-acetylglucosamine:LPS N-acetylglucosamine transferase
MPIGRKLIELGYEVHLISAMNSIEASEIVASSGIKFHSIKLARSGLNIFSEAISFFEIFKLKIFSKSITVCTIYLFTFFIAYLEFYYMNVEYFTDFITDNHDISGLLSVDNIL